ncbi:hypothetical protein ACFSKV_03415, partial [Shivajiella indica]
MQNFTRIAAISLTKSADKTAEILNGDLITYTYVVTNTGNVTINGISLNDVHPGTGTLSAPSTSDPVNNVAPGQTVTYTATYSVTQDDIDNGVAITNVATATGVGADGSPVEAIDDATITPEPALAEILIEKTGLYNDTDGDGRASAGDQITYTFTVENTGNVTLTGVVVTDPQATV